MQWIGITGPMGGGKSTISGLLRDKGYTVIDADRIVHEVLGPGGAAESLVFQTFGRDLMNSSGYLDRQALGRVVFSDPQKLDQLERILHPMVRARAAHEKQDLEAKGQRAAFYDVPLLYEKSMEDQFDHVIVVTAPQEMRSARMKLRSRLTEAEFLERTRRQLPAEVKEAKASFVIRNDQDLEHLARELERCLQVLKIPSPAPA